MDAKALWARPDLVAIEDSVYDLKAFAPHHPGGKFIRAFGGTNATAAFHSLHALSAKRHLRGALAQYKVGSFIRSPTAPHYKFDSPFALELKERVACFLRETKREWTAPPLFWLRLLVIGAATLAGEAWWALSGSLLAMVLVGVCHASIGLSVQHDASHGALSKSPALNAFFAHGADWIGNARWLWLQQHVIGHHPHTNVPGLDCDAHSAEPLLRFVPPDAQPPAKEGGAGGEGWLRQYQAMFTHLVLSLYGPTVVFDWKQVVTMNHGEEVPKSEWMQAKRGTAISLRLLYLLRICLLPYVLGGAHWLAALAGVPLITGMLLTFVFVLSHNFLDSDRDPLRTAAEAATAVAKRSVGDLQEATAVTGSGGAGGAVDWYKMQVETSSSYGGDLAMLLTGGLNLQIEHHIFPRLSSWHYPALRSVVMEVCAKHKVKYTYFPSLLHNLWSTLAYMHQVGQAFKRALQSRAAGAAGRSGGGRACKKVR